MHTHAHTHTYTQVLDAIRMMDASVTNQDLVVELVRCFLQQDGGRVYSAEAADGDEDGDEADEDGSIAEEEVAEQAAAEQAVAEQAAAEQAAAQAAEQAAAVQAAEQAQAAAQAAAEFLHECRVDQEGYCYTPHTPYTPLHPLTRRSGWLLLYEARVRRAL